MQFLSRFRDGKRVDPIEAKHMADRLKPQKIAEVNCEGGISYIISGYDSTLRVNDLDEPIRRYDIAVRAGDGVLEEFIRDSGRDEAATRDVMKNKLEPDGTLALLKGMPGQIDFFHQCLETLAEAMKKAGYELPVQAISTAILHDMDHNPPQAVSRKAAAAGR